MRISDWSSDVCSSDLLALLAATSFDGAIRRLRRNWKRLHKLVYPLTALGLLHFYMQSKVDVSEPVLLSGIFVVLLLHRLAPRMLRAAASIPADVGVAVSAGLPADPRALAWTAPISCILGRRAEV